MHAEMVKLAFGPTMCSSVVNGFMLTCSAYATVPSGMVDCSAYDGCLA